MFAPYTDINLANLSTDSVSDAVVIPATFGESDAAVCRQEQAPYVVYEQISREYSVDYAQGVTLTPRAPLPGYDSGIVGLLLLALLAAALSIRNTGNFIKAYLTDLLTVRRRSNVFDEHTVAESRITLTLGFLVCVCEALLLYLAPQLNNGPEFPGYGAADEPLHHVGALTALTSCYYLFQLSAYTIVGMVFGGRFQQSSWIKGFNTSQGLLGILMLFPVLWMLFNPSAGATAAIIGFSLYGLARITFISKGFRIFYKNPYSLIYFILYLCTLEIVPLLWVIKISAFLCAKSL